MQSCPTIFTVGNHKPKTKPEVSPVAERQPLTLQKSPQPCPLPPATRRLGRQGIAEALVHIICTCTDAKSDTAWKLRICH